MSKHTPGPWSIDVGKDSIWIGPLLNGGPGISPIVAGMSVSNRYSHELFAQTGANAKLISAAPDLLAALKALVIGREMTVSHYMWTEVQAAVAAISKAEA